MPTVFIKIKFYKWKNEFKLNQVKRIKLELFKKYILLQSVVFDECNFLFITLIVCWLSFISTLIFPYRSQVTVWNVITFAAAY